MAAAHKFVPSKYQQAIFSVIERNETNALVISAVPGAGKTETIRRLLLYMPSSAHVLAVAFNVDAAEQLARKISELRAEAAQEGRAFPAHVDALTIHKVGNARLRAHQMSGKPSDRKYQELAANLLIERFGDSDGATALAKLVSFVRLTLTDPDDHEALMRLIVRFGLDDLWEWDPQVLQDLVRVLLQRGEEAAKKLRQIDFTDMIYLPVKLGLKGPLYDYVLVDEAQDLSPCQRALVLSALKPGGTFIAVGDRRQAIYGFAGASLHSIDEIVEATGAIEMPLSICYRCAPEIVRVAAAIFPGIEPWEQAPSGHVAVVSGEQVVDLAQEGDAVLCRTNAPLVSLCLRFLRDGKRALMRGRDLGSSITSLLQKILKRFSPASLNALYAAIEQFQDDEIARLLSSKKSYDDVALQIDSVKDRVETLIILLDAYMAVFSSEEKPPMARYVGEESQPCIEGFQQALDRFFQRQSNGDGAPHLDDAIILSTVHRAKGQEWPRVFVLEWDKMPHPKAVRAEEREQEEHLRYVAVTRAKRELYLCYSPSYEGDPNDLLPRAQQPALVEVLQKEEASDSEEVFADVMTPAFVNEGQESEQETTPQPSQAKKRYDRKRLQWQGTFSPIFLEFLDAMHDEGHNKSQLVEEIVLASPQFQAWMQQRQGQQHVAPPIAIAVSAPHMVCEQEPASESSPAASVPKPVPASVEPSLQTDEPVLSDLAEAVAVPFEGWLGQGMQAQPATRRVFFVCRSWQAGDDGKRRRCGHRWAYDYLLSPEGVYERLDGEGHRHSLADDQATRRCPSCGQSFVSVRILRASFRPGTRCTNTCKHATSDHCECVCGGRNHGIGLVQGRVLYRGAGERDRSEC